MGNWFRAPRTGYYPILRWLRQEAALCLFCTEYI